MKKCPQIENLQEITPETFKEFVQFVADMRLNQRRWFASHNVEALAIAKDMERELDALTNKLLDIQMRLF